jgi:site-specific recombinase XerD
LLASLGPDFAAAFDLAKAEKAPATRKAYGTDFRLFKVYCDAKRVSALPAAPETVASYIAAEAQTVKPSTIGRRIERSATLTSWLVWILRPMLKASKRPCAAFVAPTVVQRIRKPPR